MNLMAKKLGILNVY